MRRSGEPVSAHPTGKSRCKKGSAVQSGFLGPAVHEGGLDSLPVAGTGDWEAVKTAFVDGWAKEAALNG